MSITGDNEYSDKQDPSIEQPADISQIEPDDTYQGLPVFDVDQETFFNNMRKDWNKLDFPDDSKPKQYIKNTQTRQPFYLRYKDNQGEPFIKQFK